MKLVGAGWVSRRKGHLENFRRVRLSVCTAVPMQLSRRILTVKGVFPTWLIAFDFDAFGCTCRVEQHWIDVSIPWRRGRRKKLWSGRGFCESYKNFWMNQRQVLCFAFLYCDAENTSAAPDDKFCFPILFCQSTTWCFLRRLGECILHPVLCGLKRLFP